MKNSTDIKIELIKTGILLAVTILILNVDFFFETTAGNVLFVFFLLLFAQNMFWRFVTFPFSIANYLKIKSK